MVHLAGDLGSSVLTSKNILGTLDSQIQDDTSRVNRSGQTARARPSATCSFVVVDWGRGSEPFCGAPTRQGSSYCARHQLICVLPRESVEGRSRAAALVSEAEAVLEPPPELAHLRESVLPETLPDDITDLRAFLDYPPPQHGAREPE
jgi:hypothetical protein